MSRRIAVAAWHHEHWLGVRETARAARIISDQLCYTCRRVAPAARIMSISWAIPVGGLPSSAYHEHQLGALWRIALAAFIMSRRIALAARIMRLGWVMPVGTVDCPSSARQEHQLCNTSSEHHDHQLCHACRSIALAALIMSISWVPVAGLP